MIAGGGIHAKQRRGNPSQHRGGVGGRERAAAPHRL